MRTNLRHLLSKGLFILLLALAPCRTTWSDVVRMLDDSTESGAARIDLIQQAQQTSDVEYCSMYEGERSEFFLGVLFEDMKAAKVEVETLRAR